MAESNATCLGRQGRVLDINRRVEKTEPVQYPVNFREMAAELHYRSGIAGGEFGLRSGSPSSSAGITASV